MNYREALEWAYSLQVHGIELGLAKMTRLCEALRIDVRSSAERRFIHVAGTNGKGSVCAMAAAIAVASGMRTALYTSPHLVSFRERIQLGGRMIPEEHVAEGLSEIREATAGWEQSPTFFEVATALALAWCQKQRVEWVALETGLGGRLDATNVVTPAVSVITSIGLDHTKYLGSTLAEIAREKAGIIKPGVPIITLPQAPEAEEVIREVAARVGAPLTVLRNPVAENWELALSGSHQRWNAALAFAAVVLAGLRPRPHAVAEALRNVEWPGRFQSAREGRVILDGAHNPPAAERLAQTWRERFGEERCVLVVGVLADKDVRGVLEWMLPIAARVICVRVQNPRAMNEDELAGIVRTFVPADRVHARPSLGEGIALAEAGTERMLIAGSLFLVGEALSLLGLAEGAHELSTQ